MPDQQFKNVDWFLRFLDAQLDRFEAQAERVAVARAIGQQRPPRAVAETWLSRSLRDRGIEYGTPLFDPELDPDPEGLSPDLLGLLVALRHQCELAFEVSAIFGRDQETAKERRAELVLLFAIMAGDMVQARSLERALSGGKRVSDQKVGRSVGKGIQTRLETARGLTASHRANLYLDDAERLARLAIDFYDRRLDMDDVQTHLEGMDETHCLAVIEAIAGVAWSDGELVPEEQAIIKQRIALSRLSLGARRRAVKAVQSPRPVEEIAADVKDPETRQFVLRQVVMESLCDGVLQPQEVEYIASLARCFGMTEEHVAAVEAEVADFYSRNRDFLDLSPSGGALQGLYDQVLRRVTEAVRLNMGRIVQEVRETGELSKLLVKAGRREQLTPEEKAKVVAQLLDICKSIPALAIFALPGGGLLLPVVIRLLPFNLLPSAFGGDEQAAAADAVGRK